MRLLLRRHGDGIGDWIMMLQAMKHVNLWRPDVRLDVSFELELRHARTRKISELVPDAFDASDVDFSRLDERTLPDVVIPHVVYPNHSDKPYVEGMLDQIAHAIGAPNELPFEADIVPTYAGPVNAPIGYVGFVAQSKRETSWKNWGLERFERLGQRIAPFAKLVQIGASGDYELQGAPYHRALGGNFAHLCWWLRRCDVVVTLENGIAVLCGHLEIPHIVIHMTDRTEGRLVSSTGEPLRRPTVDQVFESVKKEMAL